ncbi:DNA-3-methyladenine glycosylase [Nocardioides panacis]|uniref:Putative 3-methyladenine DNA glycosylase n=1 Tax=Nocardioides panacis TaxID=2849501 RepID=A0A975T264_9ACTN|nr:DNA-3-methyladenine glycosylase [Nocardioides panacis]QWZ10202.1 DNA-3-methyladenine glycosylase [Nocardioides panacis]
MRGWPDSLTGDVLDVAPRLLGAVLRHDTDAGPVAVRVTEVEAYDGQGDPGSHAANGRTRRNATMFGPPGRLYVYFTYGMHYCCNVVVGPEGSASAVLLRAGEVVEGRELARERRGSTDRDLARGPARLCQALGIDLSHDGTDLTRGPLVLSPADAPAVDVRTGPRVGLRLAADRPWRFWLDGDPSVSTYRPAVQR